MSVNLRARVMKDGVESYVESERSMVESSQVSKEEVEGQTGRVEPNDA
jgi:hypothetical protein